MTAQPPADELRSLLHERPEAAEPGLLAELADVLPETLVSTALLAVALGPRLPRRSLLRERVLAALARRVEGSPEVLERVPAEVFLELARFLSPALSARIEAHDPVVGAVALAARATAAGDARLLAEARAAWEEANPTAWQWDELLEALAPPAPGSVDVDPAVAELGTRAADAARGRPEHERLELLGPVVYAIGERLGGLGSAPPEPAAEEPMPAEDMAPGREEEPHVILPNQPDAPEPAIPHPPVRVELPQQRSRPSLGSVPKPARARKPERPPSRDAPERERVVNTGFAAFAAPERLLSPHLPLSRGRRYWLCVEIGDPLARSVEPERTRLPTEHLPREARLVVALFAFDGELELDPEVDTGELQLRADGSVAVAVEAGAPAGVSNDLRGRRLFFPVRTPKASGRVRLRCNIYCRGVLVQSRLVTARVARLPVPSRHALRAQLEYSLSRAIGPVQLGALTRHKLSLMLNGPGDGTHTFRVLADDGTSRVKTDSTFDGHILTGLIERARASLREVAWGDEEEWTRDKSFRYGPAPGIDLERLREDLARLAVAGYRIYTAIVDGLRGSETLDAFEELLGEPGYVQLAAQDGRMLVPLTVVYDYSPFDDAAPFSRYTLCETFADALREHAPLEEVPCLAGRCPARGEDLVVCPSGFWGYRHFLGLPLSSTLDVQPLLDPDDARRVVFGAAHELDQVVAHENALRPFARTFSSAHSRRELLDLLRTEGANVVYLYCHGGLDRNQPYLLVGSGDDGPLTRAYMFRRISWSDPRPIVVANGCHTTAVRPDQAFDLVSAFVQQANAAGVIGTEITVGESLARAFGEEFVRRFVVLGEPLGVAVRNTRLALLAAGNPLGLVYVPFGLAALALRPPQPTPG